ncbi:MAG: GtrA family protein [Pseudomonadales bacterium]|nr:GtrA family protein [Pseudomonadales bacterium]
MKRLGLQFGRFVGVGSICLALNVLMLYGLTDVLGLHYLLSCCVAIIAVNGIGFLLNKTLTFTDAPPVLVVSSGGFWQFFRYNTVSIISFLLVMSQMYILVDVVGIWYIYANIAIGVVMAFINFFMHKYFTYVDPK